MGKPTMGENPTISEDYALLFSSLICNADTNKVALSMVLPMTMWPIWILQDILLLLLCFNIHTMYLS